MKLIIAEKLPYTYVDENDTKDGKRVKCVLETDIMYAPSIDAIPVVRCKDCYRGYYCCRRPNTDPNWFCADGETEEDYYYRRNMEEQSIELGSEEDGSL